MSWSRSWCTDVNSICITASRSKRSCFRRRKWIRKLRQNFESLRGIIRKINMRSGDAVDWWIPLRWPSRWWRHRCRWNSKLEPIGRRERVARAAAIAVYSGHRRNGTRRRRDTLVQTIPTVRRRMRQSWWFMVIHTSRPMWTRFGRGDLWMIGSTLQGRITGVLVHDWGMNFRGIQGHRVKRYVKRMSTTSAGVICGGMELTGGYDRVSCWFSTMRWTDGSLR